MEPGESAVPKRARRRGWKVNAITAAVSVVLGLSGAEALVRWQTQDSLRIHRDSETPVFRYDAELGWIGRSHLRVAEGSPPVIITTNAEGFRDVDHDLRASAPRVLFLGDSYTWGHGVAERARFTDILRERFPWLDIHNMGVVGFGTDQELLVLRREGPRLHPALVVVTVCQWNDATDNRSSYNNDWAKPYFQRDRGQLALRGVPTAKLPRFTQETTTGLARYSYAARFVERTMAMRSLGLPPPAQEDITADLLMQMKSEAEAMGARFLIAFTAEMPEVMKDLDAKGCPYLSFEEITRHDGRWNADFVFPDHGWHWNANGHRRVANVFADKLEEMGFGRALRAEEDEPAASRRPALIP